jgi:hypothetical protein
MEHTSSKPDSGARDGITGGFMSTLEDGPRGSAATSPTRPAANAGWLHTHDYRAAIAKAVDWLGDRYLLAKPMRAPQMQRNRYAAKS